MNSRIAVMSLLLLAAVVGCDAGGSSAGKVPAGKETSAKAQVQGQATGRRALGINLAQAVYWSGERDFMNLAMGDSWRLSVDGRLVGVIDESRVDPVTGVVKALGPRETAMVRLTPPPPRPGGVEIRCTLTGTGSLSAGGDVQDLRKTATGIEFRTMVQPPREHVYWLVLERTDPADPVRSIDCREKDASPDALFAPEFLESLKPFGVLRFLDWQLTNQNKGGVWALRTQPTAMTHGRREGVAIEHMVALANATGADPWFLMPYNADGDYVRHFAAYVHEHLDPRRTVYVEYSNEVWNYAFPVAKQAQDEGLALKLSEAPFRALLFRYIQKATAAFDIWSAAYADRPGRLVRVLGSQSAVAWTAEQMLGYRDTAKRIDAVATAPYFGFNPTSKPEDRPKATSVDGVMGVLAERVVSTLERDAETGVVAAKHGLRHITYEAGQHAVIADNVPLLQAVQHDPRLYGLYSRYLRDWHRKQGDLMVLFNTTSRIDRHGAWGLREYSGQPLAETPKRRAVLDFAAELSAGR